MDRIPGIRIEWELDNSFIRQHLRTKKARDAFPASQTVEPEETVADAIDCLKSVLLRAGVHDISGLVFSVVFAGRSEFEAKQLSFILQTARDLARTASERFAAAEWAPPPLNQVILRLKLDVLTGIRLVVDIPQLSVAICFENPLLPALLTDVALILQQRRRIHRLPPATTRLEQSQTLLPYTIRASAKIRRRPLRA